MTREWWLRVEPLFSGALEQPPDEREAWLRRECASDEVRDEVLGLLRAHDTPGDFLDAPPTIDPAADDGDETPLQPGTRVGSYLVEAEIGRGGMGIVYRARDERLGRLVALKALPPALALDERGRERLRREARAAAALTHPGIAVVYALEEIDDQLFIAAEYLTGRTLRSAIAGGPLPVARALAIATDIARALCAAHEAGVVHRDVKPGNVLLTDDGRVKVLDFEIATLAGGDASTLTRPGAAPGTPAYMAPEQLAGGPVDFRTDIYALGVVLIEMVTGVHPLAAGGGRLLPPAVAHIAGRCLSSERTQRYASTQDLVTALEGAAVRAPSSARRWWEFHQAATSIVYGVMMIPLWFARGAIGVPLGRALFIAGLASAIVSSSLRLHLWFTSRLYSSELRWVRRRVGRWKTIADWTFVLVLAIAGLIVGERRAPLAILLLAVGIGSAVAFLVIEPATTRAAFERDTGRKTGDRRP